MTARCVACGAPAQPDTDYCLACEVELAASFIDAREYLDERDDMITRRCADPAQQELEF